MSYKNAVLKDKPLGFWPMDDYSLAEIYDISPAQNGATYSAALSDSKEMPLTYGCVKSFKNNNQTITFPITRNSDRALKDFYLYSDNDFTLEAWFYPYTEMSEVVRIIATDTNDIGIFYDSGTISFKVFDKEIRYTLPHTSQSFYIVGTYQPEKMCLYINGEIVYILPVSKIVFSEDKVTLKSGPTATSNEQYLINSIAMYRYALNDFKIKEHFNYGQSLYASQIVKPHGGELFEFYDDNVVTQYVYSYPGNKSLEYLLENIDGLAYDELENIVYIPTGAGDPQSIQINDLISVPSGVTITDSKIEWDGDNGVTVETSLDGSVYTQCINGQSIPGYELNVDGEIQNRLIHIRMTFDTTDDSKYNPSISYLSMTFYKNQITYANNSASYFEVLEPTIGNSPINVSLSNYKYPILSRHDRNGVKVLSGSGFIINPVSEVSTIEFFYTPTSLTSTMLFEATGASYGSTGPSTIDYENISALLVNGVDKISETSISGVLSLNKLHHIVAILEEPITGPIRFHNSAVSDGLYQNIAVYSKQLSGTEAVENYYAYTNPGWEIVQESAMTMTEDEVAAYDNDWVVIQSV